MASWLFNSVWSPLFKQNYSLQLTVLNSHCCTAYSPEFEVNNINFTEEINLLCTYSVGSRCHCASLFPFFKSEMFSLIVTTVFCSFSHFCTDIFSTYETSSSISPDWNKQYVSSGGLGWTGSNRDFNSSSTMHQKGCGNTPSRWCGTIRYSSCWNYKSERDDCCMGCDNRRAAT